VVISPLKGIPPQRELRKDSKFNEASLALLLISFCGYYFSFVNLFGPQWPNHCSLNKFCPSAVFEYLFFQDGKDWFEGTLGSGDWCFKEPKPSRLYLEWKNTLVVCLSNNWREMVNVLIGQLRFFLLQMICSAITKGVINEISLLGNWSILKEIPQLIFTSKIRGKIKNIVKVDLLYTYKYTLFLSMAYGGIKDRG